MRHNIDEKQIPYKFSKMNAVEVLAWGIAIVSVISNFATHAEQPNALTFFINLIPCLFSTPRKREVHISTSSSSNESSLLISSPTVTHKKISNPALTKTFLLVFLISLVYDLMYAFSEEARSNYTIGKGFLWTLLGVSGLAVIKNWCCPSPDSGSALFFQGQPIYAPPDRDVVRADAQSAENSANDGNYTTLGV